MTTPERANTPDHPGIWTAEHPEGCPSCQVCASCFRPRLRSAIDPVSGICVRCAR